MEDPAIDPRLLSGIVDRLTVWICSGGIVPLDGPVNRDEVRLKVSACLEVAIKAWNSEGLE
jgi:hypothetical protein